MKKSVDFILEHAVFSREGNFHHCYWGGDEGRGETKREAALEALCNRQLRDIDELKFAIERRDDEIEALRLIFSRHNVKIFDILDD